MKQEYVALMLVAGLLLAGAAGANERVERPLTAGTRALFEDQAAAIRQQMEPGGYYEFVPTPERIEVEQSLERMAGVLTQQTDPTSMRESDKAVLLQAQEAVNAVLTRNDGRRLVCRRERPTGSHLGKDKCQTLAERERARRSSEAEVRRLQMKSPGSSGLPNASTLRGSGGN